MHSPMPEAKLVTPIMAIIVGDDSQWAIQRELLTDLRHRTVHEEKATTKITAKATTNENKWTSRSDELVHSF